MATPPSLVAVETHLSLQLNVASLGPDHVQVLGLVLPALQPRGQVPHGLFVIARIGVLRSLVSWKGHIRLLHSFGQRARL